MAAVGHRSTPEEKAQQTAAMVKARWSVPPPRWPPRTAADLQRLWDLRDHRYALRKHALTQQENAAVGAARRFDVLALPVDQQGVGQRMLVRHGWA